MLTDVGVNRCRQQITVRWWARNMSSANERSFNTIMVGPRTGYVLASRAINIFHKSDFLGISDGDCIACLGELCYVYGVEVKWGGGLRPHEHPLDVTSQTRSRCLRKLSLS